MVTAMQKMDYRKSFNGFDHRKTVSTNKHVVRSRDDYSEYSKAHVIVYAQIGDTDLYEGTKANRWFTIRTC